MQVNVNNNYRSFQKYTNSDNHSQQTADNPGLKPFKMKKICPNFFQVVLFISILPICSPRHLFPFRALLVLNKTGPLCLGFY